MVHLAQTLPSNASQSKSMNPAAFCPFSFVHLRLQAVGKQSWKSSKTCKILLTVHLLLSLYKWNVIKSVKWNMTESHVSTPILSRKVSNLGVLQHNNTTKTHTSSRTENAQNPQARELRATTTARGCGCGRFASTPWMGGTQNDGLSAHFSFMFLNCCLVKVSLLKNMTR